MTRRDYCRAMLLDFAHPDRWSEPDRDAFLRWRLGEIAEWARRKRVEWEAEGRTRAAYAEMLRTEVGQALSERWSLYRARYKRCRCERCAPKVINPFFERVYAELQQIERTIRTRGASGGRQPGGDATSSLGTDASLNPASGEARA